jgi:hypothetical protein
MESTFKTIQDILLERFKEFQKNPEASLQSKSKEYNKKWSEAVNYFVLRINQDRKKEKKPLVTFIQIRMRLVALREIDDLRWFYRECIRYSNTYEKKLVNGKPVRNTFSKCFYGATKVK